MKICENCGREYGNDNPFCPFCDERYGVVILENDVISADGLPPYKEEFPVIGETGVKLESFADNRDEIFERNIRLAEIGNFMPNVEVRKAYKPVVPLVQVDSNGSIAPYKPPNPIVEKLFKRWKILKTAKVSKPRKILCILASVYLIILLIAFIGWFRTTDIYRSNKQFKEEKKAMEKTAKYVEYESAALNIPEEITITGESGFELKLTNCIECDEDNIYKYDFEFKNTLDYDTLYFWNDFVGTEYGNKFKKMVVSYPNGGNATILWIVRATPYYDGYDGYSDISYDGVDEQGRHIPPRVYPNDTLSGEIWLDFSGD